MNVIPSQSSKKLNYHAQVKKSQRPIPEVRERERKRRATSEAREKDRKRKATIEVREKGKKHKENKQKKQSETVSLMQ